MSVKITIPTPCHEDWNTMTPNDKGRHCNQCVKTVVDFTTWQPQQILLHMQINKNVCGRFTEEQLYETIPTQEDFVKQIAYFRISTLKKVAAIFLFAFMIGASSCYENKNTTQGVITSNYNTNNKKIDTQKMLIHDRPLSTDTNNVNIISGDISVINLKDTPIKKLTVKPIIKKPLIIAPVYNRKMITGEIAMVDSATNIKPVCIPKENENIIQGKIRMVNKDTLK